MRLLRSYTSNKILPAEDGNLESPNYERDRKTGECKGINLRKRGVEYGDQAVEILKATKSGSSTVFRMSKR